ncbi:NAD(P)H-dependent oxidoreductase [Dyadobacter arcticus]|uniref:NADPH-quinone reductase n=1 Tax=Dyadobacter arcticus TaxID=1078754 RepID=A0ABX0UHZ1_9BACT|nr:NAD(P)H-dependent oxidoreductase [Dyadobacter arcticus]NIJ52637.1 putative NADPH-quinone reductase [Dyadobacter arcticus]
MNILIVLAHPKKESLNAALAYYLAKQLNEKHEVVLQDLYREGFDPILKENELLDINYFSEDIRPYCDALLAADILIVIHPNWWGSPPAMMKGWIDRVIRLNVGYGFNDKGEGEPVKLLKLKHFFVFNTSNTPEEREQNVFHDPLENIWKYCIAGFLGSDHFERRMFNMVVTSTENERSGWLTSSYQLIATSVDAKLSVNR